MNCNQYSPEDNTVVAANKKLTRQITPGEREKSYFRSAIEVMCGGVLDNFRNVTE